jgi:hypothetical protein
MKIIKSLLLLLIVVSTSACRSIPDESELRAEEVIAKTQDRQEQILRQQLSNTYPPSGLWYEENFAFAAYYFNQKTHEADEGLIRVQDHFMDELTGSAHWHVYLLARLYWMYSSKGTNPRMSQEAENALVSIMYEYLSKDSYVGSDMGDIGYVWTYKGSENHHLQGYVSTWSAAHILKELPEYKDVKIDGIEVSSLALSLDSYFKSYFKEKATKGLLTEVASPGYAKYSLNTLYNIYDFAEDEELKNLADMFLNLYFADWAIEQFDGLRGGSKHRSYTGVNSYGLSANEGWFPFGLGTSTKHPGYTSAVTTTWRPNVLVAELALAQEDRGTYEITSRRPGLIVAGSKGNEISPDGGEFLRYTYHTPQFNMGVSMVPALNASSWVGVSSQNRCNLILFSGTPAKIYTQRPTRSSGSVYNAEWGVQHKGVRILQMLPAPFSEHATGQLVFFSKSLDLKEEGAWVFAEAADAYCAVKVAQGNAILRSPTKEDYRGGKGDLNAGTYLDLENSLSPIVFEISPKEAYVSYAAFKEEIKSNTLTEEGSVLTYSSKAYENTLTLYSDYSQLPKINSKTVNLNPDFVYQSPFINGDFGQGVVTISKGGKKLVLNFND